MGVEKPEIEKPEGFKMAQIDLLSATKVESLKTPGDYLDGRGLYLQVRSKTSKSWLFKYSLDKKTREMGLGPLETISLADAREKRDFYRRMLKAEKPVDPIEFRKRERAEAALDRANTITFKEACAKYVEAKREEWKSRKHEIQWDSALQRYAFPTIGGLSVRDIDDGLVVRVLQPIWTAKLETATRVRSRIKSVLDWATVSGFRKGENPARWTGHLEHLLASPEAIRKVKPVEHHPSLPWEEVPSFMQDLRTRDDAISASAMEFLILTATRTDETISAKWIEIDAAKLLWNVPRGRMKESVAHQVPLSPAAVAVLERMRKLTNGEFIFFGQNAGQPLSNMALLTLIKRMTSKRAWIDPTSGRTITSHGFRTSFRNWAAEHDCPDAVAEACIAHKVSDDVVAAYKRTTFAKLRREWMERWAKFATSDPAKASDNVVAIRA
jgi:integrase